MKFGPRLLFRGNQLPHETEPENDWVFRILGIPLDQDGVWIVTIEETGKKVLLQKNGSGRPVVSLDLPKARKDALRTWIDCVDTLDSRSKFVSLVIMGPNGDLILQKKDATHPNLTFRHKLCWWGGAVVNGENYCHAMHRELYEEIRDTGLVDSLCHRMSQKTMYMRSFGFDTADGNEGVVLPYVAQAPDDEVFKSWKMSFITHGVSEGEFVFLSRKQAELLLYPGREHKTFLRPSAELTRRAWDMIK